MHVDPSLFKEEDFTDEKRLAKRIMDMWFELMKYRGLPDAQNYKWEDEDSEVTDSFIDAVYACVITPMRTKAIEEDLKIKEMERDPMTPAWVFEGLGPPDDELIRDPAIASAPLEEHKCYLCFKSFKGFVGKGKVPVCNPCGSP